MPLKVSRKREVKNKMVIRNSRKKANALMKAAKARKQGLEAQVYRTKKGYSTRTTNKK